METFATIFTSREIASILWLCLAFIVFVLHPECRLQLFNLMKAIFHRNLIILYGLLFGNLLCIICLFKWISYWEISFLYDAAMWFLFTAIGLLLRLKDVRNKILAVLGIENLDRPIWVDNYDHTTNQYVTSIRHEKVLLGETWQWNIASLYCKSHEK